MDHFSSHFLLPEPQDFTPSPEKVFALFKYFSDIGILTTPIELRLRIASDENLYARNARTGEKILLGKRLRDVPIASLDEIENLLRTTEYVLAARCSAPLRSLPFDVSPENKENIESLTECGLSLTCVLRNQPTQLSEPWHEHLRTFLLPNMKAANTCERCGAIHTPEEEVQPRFWIEFSLTGVFLRSFKHSEVPMQPEVLTRIEEIFSTQFFHGRSFN